MLRILVTGITGQVGYELARTLAPLGEIVGADRAAMNLADPDAVRAMIRRVKPHILVNPAGYTAVDKAEREESLAMAVNGVAPGVMAEEMRRLGGLLVHYSTDYVFDGRKAGPWVEEDRTAPLSAYGRTKLAGEEAVRAVGGAHLVLRTSWVYGRRGANFLLTMLRLARERDELRIVADQVGAPTWCRNLARATARAVERMIEERPTKAAAVAPGFRTELGGVYHVTDGGITSWHGFASRIVATAPELAARRQVVVRPITTAEYPLPAVRPANSVLDNTRFMRAFEWKQAAWVDALEDCLREPAETGLAAAGK